MRWEKWFSTRSWMRLTWLVYLTSGKYNVEATLQGKKQQQSVDIAESTRAKIVFSFDVPVDRALEKAPNK